MASLEDEISDLKTRIAGYEAMFDAATTESEKQMYANLIIANVTRLTEKERQLTALLQQQQQQQQAQAGGGQVENLFLIRGCIKYARSRSGCRFKVYEAAERCIAKVRYGVEGDGISYSGVADLTIQLVFKSEERAEEFETAVKDIPWAYRKRPFLSTLQTLENESDNVPDICVVMQNIEVVPHVTDLQRVWRCDYGRDEDTTSPVYDPLAGSLTSSISVDIDSETLLRLIESPQSLNLFRQKPEKCHLMSQTKFPDYRRDPNNIVFMSRTLHQHFDVIDSTEGIATFLLQYVEHNPAAMDGIVNSKPSKVYETRVNVVFKDEEARQQLAPLFRDYNLIDQCTVQLQLYFPDPVKFRDFAEYKAEAIKASWRQYDGEL